MAAQNQTDRAILAALSTQCPSGPLGDFCTGLMMEMSAVVLPIVREAYLGHATDICVLAQACPANSSASAAAGLPSLATLIEAGSLAPQQKKPVPSRPSKHVGTFLQISDLHYDAWYAAGTNAQCEREACCHVMDGPASTDDAVAADIGEYKCASSALLLDQVGAVLAKINPKPDFILWTGDALNDHYWQQSRQEVLWTMEYLCDLLSSVLPNVPVVPALGNHDTYPIGQVSGLDDGSYDWLFGPNGLSSPRQWGRWLDAAALAELKQHGYFSMRVQGRLRVVSLNTQFGQAENYYLVLSGTKVYPSTDTAKQLAWLNSTLIKARAQNEKVYIIGHVPSGVGTTSTYGTGITALVSEFSDIVVASFYGHTHHDELEIVRASPNSTQPVSVNYMIPSVTPLTDINPSYRVYSYDRDSGEVLDYTQYRADLLQANSRTPPQLEFSAIYSAKELYNLPDLSAGSWNDLLVRMWKDDALFNTYMVNYLTNTTGISCLPLDACRIANLCSALSATTDLYNACVANPPTAATATLRL
eukprot:gnl/Hemi2/17588_TR5801_c1_g1_i1.p1 gnl/Hemi2/17588_TR5801_c1_g1~~gnl/Hemi2/17588_TR5801_c1_g1_i1.p1  ORF type:complete len:582 (+),score=188.94 gnl/Hemi2/17588_TR5801_c1_g1_i1:154-1746(+)